MLVRAVPPNRGLSRSSPEHVPAARKQSNGTRLLPPGAVKEPRGAASQGKGVSAGNGRVQPELGRRAGPEKVGDQHVTVEWAEQEPGLAPRGARNPDPTEIHRRADEP